MSRQRITAVEITAYDPSRSNLLAFSRQFDQVASWALGFATITANAATGADNLALADKLVESATNSGHYVEQFAAIDGTLAHTLSVWVKRTGSSRNLRLNLYGENVANVLVTDFDLGTGAVSSFTLGTATVLAAGMQTFPDGWFRCWMTGIPQVAASASSKVRIGATSGGSASYLGDGSSGLFIDRVLLEVGTALGAYIDTGATAGPGTKILYFASGRLVTGPADTPPRQWFDDRIISAPNFARSAFGDARVTSGGKATGGVLELANADQGLVSLLDLGLDGRAIVVRVGYEGDAYPAAWTTWLAGTVEHVEMGQDTATIRLSDRTAILDLRLQATRYAGSNSGAPLAGVEGVVGDIKGLEKPLCWGRCYQVPAVLVNSYYRTYQIHDGAVQAIDAVYDKGAALLFSANYANVAALHAAVVAAGSYATCTALGLLRLGDAATGRVTVDVRGDASGTGYVDRAGAVMRRVLESKCGVPTADIDIASFAALDVAAPYELGIFVGTTSTRRAVIEALHTSVGAYCLPDRLGVWTTGQLLAPIASALLELSDADLADLRREATRDPGKGIPVWQVSLRYRRNWTTFSASDLVAVSGGFTEATRNERLQEWRTVVASDATVQTKHLLATTLEYDTLLVNEADAAAEAARRLALHKVRRDYLRVPLAATEETAALDLLDQVAIDTTVAGLSGRQYAILGIVAEGQTVTLELWG